MVEEFKITEEAFTQYTESLRQVAIKNNLSVGWEKPNVDNPFKYEIFVKDYHNNRWQGTIHAKSLDLDGLFSVWKEIEKLMMSIIEDC